MNLYRQLNRVKSLINKGETSRANELLHKILKSHPENQYVKNAILLIEHDDIYDRNLATEKEREDILKLFYSNQYEHALVKIKQAIKSYPSDENLSYMEGCCYKKLNRIENALESFSRALEMKDDFHQVYNQVGSILFFQGKLDDAIEYFKKTLSIKPDYYQALNYLGLVYSELNQNEHALKYYKLALEINSSSVEVLTNLGAVHKNLEQHDKALKFLFKAVELQPDFYKALYNLATVLSSVHRYDESIAFFLKARDIKPDSVELLNNLGIAYQNTNQLKSAVLVFKKAISINPKHYNALFNLGRVQISTGHLKEGFENYEYRYQTDTFNSPKRQFNVPRWNGQDLTGKKILIWSEQGIGDEIMFASIIPEFEHLAEKVVIECAMKLALIFQWAFPWAEVKETGPVNCIHFDYYNTFDYQIPSGSIAKFFRQSIADFEKKQKPFIPRLKAGEQKVRDNLKLKDNQLLIGLCWRSSLQTVERNIHYLEVEELAPLKAIKNATFLAVQYDDCLPELDRVRDLGLPIRYYTNIDQKEDLGSTCALLGACDLIISPGTAAIQMAAALGVPSLMFIPTGHKKKEQKSMQIPWHPTIKYIEHNPYEHDFLIHSIIANITKYIEWANQVTSSNRFIEKIKE